MKLTNIISMSEKPKIYEKGSSFMWSDEHISKQLLNIHLNPDIDLASRKLPTIIKTANWILSTLKEKGKLNILDLGCGPGIYSEIFAKAGHNVTGVDISKNSIDYAIKSAEDQKLNITYHNTNYLNIDLEADKYDLVVLIYTDLGVLLPKEKDILLKMIYQVLKKGGTFIFDVLKDNELEKRTSPKSWEAVVSGFWKASPYIALSESILYKKQKVILFQHTIIDSEENTETFRFWTHFFSQNDISKTLKAHNFIDFYFRKDILPEDGMWSGNNVIFTITSK
jgi:2-polyprenyl-3-methyl-5-hydroxy-6-metoxy-1,4-benzoquinol methylase